MSEKFDCKKFSIFSGGFLRVDDFLQLRKIYFSSIAKIVLHKEYIQSLFTGLFIRVVFLRSANTKVPL